MAVFLWDIRGLTDKWIVGLFAVAGTDIALFPLCPAIFACKVAGFAHAGISRAAANVLFQTCRFVISVAGFAVGMRTVVLAVLFDASVACCAYVARTVGSGIVSAGRSWLLGILGKSGCTFGRIAGKVILFAAVVIRFHQGTGHDSGNAEACLVYAG